MTENQNPPVETDDTEGHRWRMGADAEPADDTEGHGTKGRGFVADQEETDDTEGHGGKYKF